MTTLSEGNITLTFPDNWEVTKYDDWPFFTRFQKIQEGTKAVDFLGLNKDEKTLWLIELKDHQHFPRNKTISFWDETALKVRDTLGGVFAAGIDAHHNDYDFARHALSAHKIRVVLHLQQPAKPSSLFPRVANRANVQQKLKKIVKAVDAHPLVIEIGEMGGVEWTAAFRSHISTI